MTAYELRFQIFQQAIGLSEMEYQAKHATTSMWNDNPKNSVMMEYPDYPSYEQIEALADKINNFVSSK